MPILTIFERSRSQAGNSSYGIRLPKDELRHDGILELLEDEDAEEPNAIVTREGPGEYHIQVLDVSNKDEIEFASAD